MQNNRYKMTLCYDGTNYAGWQIQKGEKTIQESVEKAMETVLREKTSLVGSGRTDSGVHALKQVAHFSTKTAISDLAKLTYCLNGLLAKDIRILSIEKVLSTFHARYSVKKKSYHYHLTLCPYQKPFEKLYSYHVLGSIDLDLIEKALLHFIGTKDFTSFTNVRSSAKKFTKTLFSLCLNKKADGIIIEFIGNGFLYKMVRNIVGTLLDVGQKKILLEDIPKIFAAKDRKKAGKSAPAHGLFLFDVEYE